MCCSFFKTAKAFGTSQGFGPAGFVFARKAKPENPFTTRQAVGACWVAVFGSGITPFFDAFHKVFFYPFPEFREQKFSELFRPRVLKVSINKSGGGFPLLGLRHSFGQMPSRVGLPQSFETFNPRLHQLRFVEEIHPSCKYSPLFSQQSIHNQRIIPSSRNLF